MEEGGSILSCADGIARVIERHLKDNNKFISNGKNTQVGNVCPQCPDCGDMLIFKEGCVVCNSCGYSRCG
jgi:ribonucleoside-diphosphate reductase alpha chain